jgi:hypothetical protein
MFIRIILLSIILPNSLKLILGAQILIKLKITFVPLIEISVLILQKIINIHKRRKSIKILIFGIPLNNYNEIKVIQRYLINLEAEQIKILTLANLIKKELRKSQKINNKKIHSYSIGILMVKDLIPI